MWAGVAVAFLGLLLWSSADTAAAGIALFTVGLGSSLTVSITKLVRQP